MTLDDTKSRKVQLATFGEPVTVGSVTANGIVDRAGLALFQGEEGVPLSDNRIAVLVETGAFPGLALGVALVARGITYLVRERLEIEPDGKFTHLLCAKER